jgi:hypothetical protein
MADDGKLDCAVGNRFGSTYSHKRRRRG